MSRKRLKARDKITLKMSRDGAVEKNLTIGEDTRISKRSVDFDLRDEKSQERTFSQVGKSRKSKHKQRHNRPNPVKNGTAATTTADPQIANEKGDVPKNPENAVVPQTLDTTASENQETLRDEPIRHANNANSGVVRQFVSSNKSKILPVQPQKDAVFSQPVKQSAIPPTNAVQPIKHEAAKSRASETQAEIPIEDVAEQTEIVPQSALKHDVPDILHFESQGAESKPRGRKSNKQPKSNPISNQAAELVSESVTMPLVTPKADTVETPTKPSKHYDGGTDSPLHSEKAETPLHMDKADVPLKPDKSGKLNFASDETTPDTPKITNNRRLNKTQAQVERASGKLEKAQSNLPVKKKLRKKTVVDEKSGKVKKKLHFETEVKTQGEHLKGLKPLRPIKAVGNSALMFAHTKIYQVESENVATEAVHKGEVFAEGVARSALRHHKLAPYRKVAKLERVLQKKTVNVAYQKAIAENPKLKSNPLSRAFQKRKIKKDYAKAAREAQKTAKRAKQAGSAVSNAAKALAGVVKRHPIAAAVIVLILLLLYCLISIIGAFGSAGSSGLGGLLSVSYLAEDTDIDNAELDYTEWETDLQIQIANTESTHSGYDEYRYNVGDISHNPYELMAYLTAKYQNFTYTTIQAELRTLFSEQYSLTVTPTIETRYADPTDANNDGDYEPYDWNVMTITLTARSFSEVVASHLNEEESAHYALLMQSKGARQYLANPFGDMNWLSYVTSYYGYRIHPISGAKDYHKGVDIGLPTGTPIQSGQDGKVTFASYSGDYGNVVVIENEIGLISKYAHCDTLAVTIGQTVKSGDVIATVGNTGASTGSHLHIEVLKNGQHLNGLYFIDTGNYTATPTYGNAGLPVGNGSFEALMAAAATVEGMPYVWGGSSPATSFDCSGLVCYLYRVAGIYDFGRLTANDIYNVCDPIPESEAQPGDLVFLHSTYSTSKPITHIAIYVGYIDGLHPYVFHAGDPIGFTRIDTPYWQSHFYGYARIPTE